MKFPVYVLGTVGSAQQVERFVPREWRGELTEDLFSAQFFADSPDAARRLTELLKQVRGDLRTLAIYRINNVPMQRLANEEAAHAHESAIDQDIRAAMSPEQREFFRKHYRRRDNVPMAEEEEAPQP